MTKPTAPEINIENLLPTCPEVEEAIIARLIISNDLYPRVSKVLKSAHFSDENLQIIYEAMGQLIAAGRAADPITLKPYLQTDPEHGRKWMEYLVRLLDAPVVKQSLMEYAAQVMEYHGRREIVRQCAAQMKRAGVAEFGVSLADLMNDHDARIQALRPEIGVKHSGFMPMSRLARETAKRIDDEWSGRVKRNTLSTGYDSLDTAIGGIEATDVLVIAGRPGSGKAQPLSAHIKTLTGWKAMGEIRVGDEIASHDGLQSRVIGVYPQGLKEVFDITFSDGRKTQACAEHLWSVTYRGWSKPRIIDTKQLQTMLTRARYRNRLSIDLVSGDFGHSDPLPIHPYLLGVILGNGAITGGLTLSTRNEENLDRFEALLPAGMRLNRRDSGVHSVGQREGQRHGGFEVSKNPMVSELKDLGLHGGGCHEMFIPAIYLSANREARQFLLHGLMDSNGTVSAGVSTYITTSQKLASGVEELVRSLGGLSHTTERVPTYPYNGAIKEGRVAYRCNIRHHNEASLFQNSTKKALAKRGRNRSVRLNFAKITASESVETQCIKVSHPSSLYLTDQYVVTHNTSLGVDILFNVAMEIREKAETARAAGEPDPNECVAAFSIEMSESQIVERMFSRVSKVMGTRIRRRRIDKHDMQAIWEAAFEMERLNILIDPDGKASIADICARARELNRKKKLRLLLIDFLQLVEPFKKNNRRDLEISEITAAIKALAKELGCPIILLSQVKREVDDRPNKIPKASDVAEGGTTEQNCDSMLTICRQESYLIQDKPEEGTERFLAWEKLMRKHKGVAQVFTAKSRHGGQDVISMGFNGALTTFIDRPAPREPEPMEAREAVKSEKLSQAAIDLRDVIMALSFSDGKRPTREQLDHDPRLRAGARLVLRSKVKDDYAAQIMPDADEKKFGDTLNHAAGKLRTAGVTQTFRDRDGQDYIFLIDTIAN